VAQFKHGGSSTCDAPHQPKTVTTLDIDQIHELILEHRQPVSAK
jgi:hypothetical protein